MFNERISLGMPSLAGYELFEALQKTKELGFKSVMSLPGGPNAKHSQGEFPTFNFYEADEEYKERLRSVLSFFLHISIHQAWNKDWKSWIDCADYFGAEIVTVHAGKRKTDQTLEQFLSKRAKYLRQIGDYAQKNCIKIGVENEGGKYDDYICLIESLNHPSVGATIDVGHCAYFDEIKSVKSKDERVEALNELIRSMVKRLGEKVYHFHLHNVRKKDWRDHRSVTDGVIDFPFLIAALKEIGYSGLFDIELEEPEKEKKSQDSGQYLTELLKD